MKKKNSLYREQDSNEFASSTSSKSSTEAKLAKPTFMFNGLGDLAILESQEPLLTSAHEESLALQIWDDQKSPLADI